MTTCLTCDIISTTKSERKVISMFKLVICNKFSGERLVVKCKDHYEVNKELADFAWLRGWSWDNAPCGWRYSISEWY